jgi:hypothetical protein
MQEVSCTIVIRIIYFLLFLLLARFFYHNIMKNNKINENKRVALWGFWCGFMGSYVYLYGVFSL